MGNQISAHPEFKFEIEKGNELLLNVSEGVFLPTGTTSALLASVCSQVNSPGKVLDLGCGCGVMGIALYKLGLVKPPLYASDLSQNAIACLIKNAESYSCPVVAKQGSLFEPWKNDSFDYIVNDVSGVAEQIARISPWFSNVPCESGEDGAGLVVKIIREAASYLNAGGKFFFPVISLSNVERIIAEANKSFASVTRIMHQQWPLPKEMLEHSLLINEMREKGLIQVEERFGMLLWFTDIYVAGN